jgi:hypothetical protein
MNVGAALAAAGGRGAPTIEGKPSAVDNAGRSPAVTQPRPYKR